MNKKNNRIQTSLPITGLDISTPDNLVADGKQSTLHNARFSGSAWRNIRPFAFEDVTVPSELSGIEIIYHHPAAGDNTNIASRPMNNGMIDLYFIKIEDSSMVGTVIASALPPKIKISHFGNILIVADVINEVVSYYYFNSGAYEKFSVPKPPVIGVKSNYQNNISNLGRTLQFVGTVNDNNRIPFFDMQNGTFYFPQYSENGGFWGEICYFAAFQMSDGTILAPSALHICSSEPLDCSQESRRFEFGDNEIMRVALFYIDKNNKKIFIEPIAVQEDDDFKYPNFKSTVYNATVRQHIRISLANTWIKRTIGSTTAYTAKVDVNDTLITHVNIYSTRINPLWDAEKLKNPPVRGELIDYDSANASNNHVAVNSWVADMRKYRIDNKLPEQPFYLIKSIPIDSFEHSTMQYPEPYESPWDYSGNPGTSYVDIVLDKETLDNIEMKPMYDPINVHRTYYDSLKIYNDRVHIGGRIKTTLFKGFANGFFANCPQSGDYMMTTVLNIDNEEYHANAPTNYTLSNAIYSRILSYPDYRAKKIYDLLENKIIGSVDLIEAKANNFAYAYADTSSKGELLHFNRNITGIPGVTTLAYEFYYVKNPVDFSAIIKTPNVKRSLSEMKNWYVEYNKILVSASNNPLSFPLGNSYVIGTDSNRILALNSAALEMSDAKFGEFPLYVFTEEGIFTLQSGSGEVLYSAVIPLNYDRIINPDTLAVNYNVIYITERGIHALFSNESSLISGPINDSNNHPLLDFLRTAHLCYQHINNEVMVYNTEEKSNRAFVFSLDNKTWSTRQFVGTKINNDDIIFPRTDDRIRIQRLNEEIAPSAHPDGSVFVKFVSRPIKLGSMEFKRLETFIARLVASGSYSTTITLEGSVDLKTWITLREVATSADRDISIRRTPNSFRYLRASFSVIVPDDFELSGYDLEYYTRFLHRLR